MTVQSRVLENILSTVVDNGAFRSRNCVSSVQITLQISLRESPTSKSCSLLLAQRFASAVVSVASECICRQHAITSETDSVSLCFSLSRAANFQLPEDNVLFDKVEFIELQRDEAQPLVEKYNKEGKAAQPPDSKRFRGNDRDRYSGSRFSMLTLCRHILFIRYLLIICTATTFEVVAWLSGNAISHMVTGQLADTDYVA